MLQKIGKLKNVKEDFDCNNRLNSKKKFNPIQFSKYTFKNSSDSNEKINYISKPSMKKPNNAKMKSNNDYSINSYKFIKNKALKYINSKKNNNTINKIIKLNETSISPVKKSNKKVTFTSSLCPNNPINNIKQKSRNLSQCQIITNNNYNNNDNNKGIKEIRIKSSKKFSQVLTTSKKKNNNNYDAEETIMTLSSFSDKDNNNNSIFKNYTKFSDNSQMGIYSRKKMNSYRSLSMDKKHVNTIESIEIDFTPKIYRNSSIEKRRINNSFNTSKIIIIQRYFRNYMERKYWKHKMILDKISLGIQLLKKLIMNNLSCYMKNFFILYKLKFSTLSTKNKTKYYVNKSQYEMLTILREKNILGMMNFKKYIIRLLNNNKLEMF